MYPPSEITLWAGGELSDADLERLYLTWAPDERERDCRPERPAAS